MIDCTSSTNHLKMVSYLLCLQSLEIEYNLILDVGGLEHQKSSGWEWKAFICEKPKTVPVHSSSTIHLPHTPHCCTTTGSFITKICLHFPVEFVKAWTMRWIELVKSRFTVLLPPRIYWILFYSLFGCQVQTKSDLFPSGIQISSIPSPSSVTLKTLVLSISTAIHSFTLYIRHIIIPLMLRWLKDTLPHFCTAHLSATDNCCGLL